MLAPLVGGFLIGFNWTVLEICGSNSVLALIVVGLIALLAARAAKDRAAMDSAPSEDRISSSGSGNEAGKTR
jgi:Ca2+/Na+ antiporter